MTGKPKSKWLLCGFVYDSDEVKVTWETPENAVGKGAEVRTFWSFQGLVVDGAPKWWSMCCVRLQYAREAVGCTG